MLAKWDKTRVYGCAQDSELTNWEQGVEDSSQSIHSMGNTVNAAEVSSARTCYACENSHIAAVCRNGKIDTKEDKKVHFVIDINNETTGQTWILDSGASCHLVFDEGLLYNSRDSPGVEGPKTGRWHPSSRTSKGSSR